MKSLFLGPLAHWLVLAAVVALGWAAGRIRLHVTDFNLFAVALIGVTLAIIVLVLITSPPDARITRDALEDDADD